MAYTYQIDADAGLARAVVTGRDTPQEMVGRIARITADPAWRPGFHVLCDFRDTTEFEFTADDMRSMATHHESESLSIGGGRLAIVVPNNVLYGLSRMFEILSDGRMPMAVRVFYSIDEAEAWLAGK